MSDIKRKYGSNGQTFTCTLASLTNNSARQSTEVDNTSNLFLDALVQIQIKAGGSGVLTTGIVNIYAYGTTDNGTTRGENAGASDAAITLTSPPNVRKIGTLNVVAVSTTYKSNPMSVAAAFGGILPAKWGIIIENKSGGTFDATEGNHAKLWQGILAQVA